MSIKFTSAFKMKTALIFLSILYYSMGNDIANYASVETLKLMHVVFRHGDRTPDSLYPNDPYTEADFWPFRIGHLTNKGKLTAYKIGTSLREKYGKFLGNVYTPDILYAFSSFYPRTKASLQALLAGLYPPADVLKWNSNLLWEPIPYDYLPAKDNKILVPLSACPRYLSLIGKVLGDVNNDPIALKYNYLLPFLKEASGITSANSVFEIAGLLYSTLKSEEEAGLPLPQWTKSVYPDILREISAHQWKYLSGTDDLKDLQSGFLVSQIINNTYVTVNKEEAGKNRKIYLYSGHDINVAGLLLFLDNFEPHNPNYGAHIIIEVHQVLGVYFLKFVHQNYNHAEPQPLSIPNCGIYCPLEVFVRLYANDVDPVRLETLCG